MSETTQTDLSVIVPVFNVGKYLSSCIESLLNQGVDNYEIILVDDGSTDGSGAVCDDFAKKDGRIRVIHKTNGGVSSARNAGIDTARGRWITFVDADDTVSPAYCRTICSCMADNDLVIFSSRIHFAETGAEMVRVLHDCRFTDKNRIEAEAARLKQCREQGGWNFFGYPWNKVFRRDIIMENKLRFPEELQLQEDEVFSFSYLRYVNKARLVSSVLYFYEVRHSGLNAARRTYEFYSNYARAKQRANAFVENPELLSVETNEVMMSYLNGIRLCPSFSARNRLIRRAWIYYHKGGVHRQLVRKKIRRRFGRSLLMSIVLLNIDRLYHRRKK